MIKMNLNAAPPPPPHTHTIIIKLQIGMEIVWFSKLEYFNTLRKKFHDNVSVVLCYDKITKKKIIILLIPLKCLFGPG